MGDRSPKDKQKKQKQHDKEHALKDAARSQKQQSLHRVTEEENSKDQNFKKAG
jgi:hypothetical protein